MPDVKDITSPLPAEGIEVVRNLGMFDWRIKILLALVVFLLLLWMARKVRRAIRRRRPVKLHPKLQRYGEEDPELVAKRRAEATKIIATSSTATIAGYELIEQIETIYVHGLRRPEDAQDAIKAVAAMKGANAVTNLRHERGDHGRFAAAGDAVIVRRTNAVMVTNRVIHPIETLPLEIPDDRALPPPTSGSQ